MEQPDAPSKRPKQVHVYIVDGTLSRLVDGVETNAGLLYKTLTRDGRQKNQTVSYDPGIQGDGIQKWIRVAAGMGINNSIMEGYAALSSCYMPGDAIMLFGYSRGAYAVRSLAGFIGRIGLLRKQEATHRRIERAFRHYTSVQVTSASKDFTSAYCHAHVPIDFLGVWDTVKALGLPYPILNRLAPMATEFHDHTLGPNVKTAYQALAIDENRSSYKPLPWKVAPDWPGKIEQVWFSGAHPDIGGNVTNRLGSRTLSNIPFRWMITAAQKAGLQIKQNWQDEFPMNPLAQMHGAYSGGAQYFVFRAPRLVGKCSSETIHPTVFERIRNSRYIPLSDLSLMASQTSQQTE
jgi:uncharacterized protein (DUF2235 family)